MVAGCDAVLMGIAALGSSSYQAKYWVVPAVVSCGGTGLDERVRVDTPSMPIQVEEYWLACETCTVGTTQSALTPVKVGPLSM